MTNHFRLLFALHIGRATKANTARHTTAIPNRNANAHHSKLIGGL